MTSPWTTELHGDNTSRSSDVFTWPQIYWFYLLTSYFTGLDRYQVVSALISDCTYTLRLPMLVEQALAEEVEDDFLRTSEPRQNQWRTKDQFIYRRIFACGRWRRRASLAGNL